MDTIPDIFKITIDKNLNIEFEATSFIVLIGIILAVVILMYKTYKRFIFKDIQVEEASLGIGSQKIKLKTNVKDREIAYKLWVELATRKIGIRFDEEHDVINDVYDSWYSFFGIARELIKDIPLRKFHDKNARDIVSVSISVLNKGLRPHLTEWQAKYRKWYEHVSIDFEDESPQEIQKKFPEYKELVEDLIKTNQNMINYCKELKRVIKS